MSFIPHIFGGALKTVGLRHAGGAVEHALDPHIPAPPGVPNPNDAANASQAVTDQMRMRRGMMSNIYAGAQNTQPASGKITLGT